jgi:hypothetical protein
MDRVEINLADLRDLLISVYNKAVNSYHDLSELVAEQAISDFVNKKRNSLSLSLMLDANKKTDLAKTEVSLCPSTYQHSTWNSVTFNDQFITTSSQHIGSLPHYGNYNNYGFLTTDDVSVVPISDLIN